jgi:UDP-N-acetylglucosamine 2-epimerase (non-hydrolysing)
MKILTVVGARPYFMKAAPYIPAIREHNGQPLAESANQPKRPAETIRHILVHSGQHYDAFMSGSFFSGLNLPEPDIRLGAGSGLHSIQAAEIMKNFEEVFLAEKRDVVAVVGDVNSTLACASVTSKIGFDSDSSKPVIAHVEEGCNPPKVRAEA